MVKLFCSPLAGFLLIKVGVEAMRYTIALRLQARGSDMHGGHWDWAIGASGTNQRAKVTCKYGLPGKKPRHLVGLGGKEKTALNCSKAERAFLEGCYRREESRERL